MAGASATIRPMGRPRACRNAGSPASEIAIDPRNLDACSTHPCPTYVSNHPQVDVSTQVDLNTAVIHDWNRRVTPMYSREDFKEQYCITSRQLDAVEKSGGGIFGCLSTKGASPCSATRVSILSACVRSASSDENICDAPYPRKPFQIYYQQPYPSYHQRFSRYDLDEDEWIQSSYFRRRPTSFCTTPDPKSRYTWLSDDEESMRLEGPRPVLPAISQPPHSAIHKPKHVSFARSQTLTSIDMASRSRSPPRPHTQERLIDSQPTATPSMLPGSTHLYQPPEPKILVLEKTKKSAMKTQATQTDLSTSFKRIPPVTLSPRTIHRVKMVSQGAQTNGIINGRRLTKSYSEAGQFGTHSGGSGSKEEGADHEPLQRTQSEEPPRSPFLVDTPPDSPSKDAEDHQSTNQHLLNGSIEQLPDKEEPKEDEKEILIDFKPAPVSPDARAMLKQMPMVWKRPITLQKTLSDGEIRVERRELVDEAGAPSYPHTCRRNYFDPWRTVRPPVQFSSTPDDLSLLRTCTPTDEHHEEEFHENIIRRGLFRKRSVSLEDGVQELTSGDFSLPRSLPTSPTSPTAHQASRKIEENPRFEIRRPSFLRTFPVIGPVSPFASSDSLTNDVTKDHSDGIWNESQATVLQADSLSLLTPSSRRRHLLLLQHQQRSSMDTEALDIEEEIDIGPPSPRIRLEAPANIILTPSEPLLLSNGRPRSGLRRRSPGPPYSQPQSQSSSELALSIGRTDSGRTNTTDLSEASTTEDYITANTSTGTGTATGTSATTSSWSRPGAYQASSSAAASASASTTATAAEGSSFESASSIYSLARSEAVVEEPASPKAILEEMEMGFDLGDLAPPSPARSTSSSSSGSYDLEDAMPDPYPTAPLSGHTSEAELDHEYHPPRTPQEYRSPSSNYTESPVSTRGWTEEERKKKRKTFTLDFPSAPEDSHLIDKSDIHLESMDVSPTPSHRHRPRSKLNAGRTPYRNNKKRESVPSPMSALSRSPQKEDWLREPADDSVQIPTSDDSSCSHHYHLHHHHHHLHRDNQEGGRYRRTRESPRRKTNSYLSTRRRSNEDKNAALTGSLPRRRTRQTDDICFSRLSPGGRYSRSPGHNSHTAIIVKSPSPETRLKALSAESLRSVSPGSDSVFYSESAELCIAHHDTHHCHNCGKEVMEEIVQPPADFADSPEGPRVEPKHQSHRLYKKLDKRYRSEDRGERRYHRSNGRSDVRAKSEERGRSSSRGSLEDGIKRRLQARSTDVSMETLAYREDEDTYVEPYKDYEWIYIGELEESHVWKRPDSRDGDDESSEGPIKDRRGSQGSTESEKCFRKKYQAATHRMVHRKSSGEMYKRIQSKSFESDKTVVVKREAGGEFGFRIHGSKPVVVSAIEPDTPAENSGLEVGDIIMSVNGRSVMDATHSEVVRLAHSGPDILELEVARTCNVLAPRVTRGGLKEPVEVAVCAGYLWRRATTLNPSGTTSAKWVRRWFALRQDNCLYYYKTDTDSQPVGAMMLMKYDVEETPEMRAHSFVIKKQNAPSHYLAADNDEAIRKWMTVIKEAVARNNQADTWLDASLRMTQMPACAIQRPDCFGYLSKQQDRAKKTSSPTGWSRRYCVLKDAALYFYDDANAEKAFGVACLHGFRVHGSAPSSGGRKHAFELQPPDPTQRSYTFATETEMDKKRWLAALEYSIDRWIKVG
ncbi:uncharacterized protein [Chelonus insularis]|uniref:uncharacterized protein isoform X1 n=1 Tax=Chelonus insularis TaxID=460826 RepID=UPI00158C22D8|nr:uncharacterized protein LOC118071836 isoform X1 [Chelonus insularis]XP_034947164.1 uncharacterized protein LOC118071836 isoform X1 [Chelonus insularis]